jgi:signal transduction histidine kinase
MFVAPAALVTDSAVTSALLAKPADQVVPEHKALIEVAHRNSLRLLKLVNSLLDFSRIESGRAKRPMSRSS